MKSLDLMFDYYNAYTKSHTLFKPLSKTEFKKILENAFFYKTSKENVLDSLIIIHTDKEIAYITLLYGNQKTKTKLLNEFFNEYPNMTLKLHFLNPACLAWEPLKDIIHPCFQGVIVNSDDYYFYLDYGFKHHTTENTYFQSLDSFTMPNDILDLKENHKDTNITYQYFDKNNHIGFNQFAKNLKAPHWESMLLNYLEETNPSPMLIALKDKTVVGFSGPLKKETTGRGFFAGIAVDPAMQGQKIGKVLFFELCARLKAMGADYMTLFTGSKNPARFIYEQAGFKCVKEVATMTCIGKAH